MDGALLQKPKNSARGSARGAANPDKSDRNSPGRSASQPPSLFARIGQKKFTPADDAKSSSSSLSSDSDKIVGSPFRINKGGKVGTGK